jgi:hypothetical protein
LKPQSYRWMSTFFDVQAGELVYGPPDVWHVALALEEMGHDGTAA